MLHHELEDITLALWREQDVEQACRELGTASVEAVAARAGYGVEEVLTVLRKLRTYGIVERAGDGWRYVPESELPW